jgi:hypothetical protein
MSVIAVMTDPAQIRNAPGAALGILAAAGSGAARRIQDQDDQPRVGHKGTVQDCRSVFGRLSWGR